MTQLLQPWRTTYHFVYFGFLCVAEPARVTHDDREIHKDVVDSHHVEDEVFEPLAFSKCDEVPHKEGAEVGVYCDKDLNAEFTLAEDDECHDILFFRGNWNH